LLRRRVPQVAVRRDLCPPAFRTAQVCEYADLWHRAGRVDGCGLLGRCRRGSGRSPNGPEFHLFSTEWRPK
jgi:hypothetical protein